MRGIAKTLSCCALLLTLGSACFGGKGSGGVSVGNNASKVNVYDCTQDNGGTGVPSGRSFNLYTRVDGGAWVGQGGVNPHPAGSDCHATPPVTLDLAKPPGGWEIRAIKLPRSNEPDCDSSIPDVR